MDKFDQILGLDEQRQQDFSVRQNKSLNIKIESWEFMHAGRYYITVQLDEYNEK